VAVDDGGGEVDHFAVVDACVFAEQFESAVIALQACPI
jgi:hypothetical protein